jgi:hypothetical protein
VVSIHFERVSRFKTMFEEVLNAYLEPLMAEKLYFEYQLKVG